MGDTKDTELSQRPFADVVRELQSGQTYEELTSLLAQVVDAVIRQRRPGMLTLKLKITPNGENSVKIADTVDFKLPASPRAESVFFVEDGALMREDPRQHKMALRSVEVAPRAVKELPPPEVKDLKTA